METQGLAKVIDMGQWLASKGVVETTYTRERTLSMIGSEEPTMTRTQVVQMERRKERKQETLRRREVRRFKYGTEVR